MKKQTLGMASFIALATVGLAEATAQDIRIDMNKEYPAKTICLQEVAQVKYIPLETKDDVLFDGTIVNLSTEGIAGFNKKQGDILLFDGTGKVIASFNHVGQGPNEYNKIYHLDVDWKQKEVYVQDNFRKKIRIYALDGKYLRTIESQGTMREGDLYHYSDKQLVYSMEPANKPCTPYQPITLLSKKDGSTTTLPFTKKEDTNVKATGGSFGNMKMSAKNVSISYKKGSNLYVNEVTSDIIYRVENSQALTPVVQRTPSYETGNGKDFFLILRGVTPRYYFFNRQQALLEFQGNAATDTKSTFVAYDRKDKSICQPTFVNNDYPSLDIPLKTIMQCAGDTQSCHLLLEAFKLKEALEKGKLKGELKAIAEKLDEEDNPVIMLIDFNR